MMHRNSIFCILALVLAVWKHPVHGQQSPLLRNRANTKEVMTDQQVDASSITETRELNIVTGLIDLATTTAKYGPRGDQLIDQERDVPWWGWILVVVGILVLAACCKRCCAGAQEDSEEQDAKAVDPRENTDEENTTTSSEAAVAR
ncbi:hypothetical protein ACHAWU_003212 [Discostella pseudostelligera]|uniref:Uncharacterized protein n=1 Tax=Discostella pseudostelligera TaxID=259834 RepID=A0ABD3N6C5_9STRA